jgi:hypothetical protein
MGGSDTANATNARDDHSMAQQITVVGMLRNFSGQIEATTPITVCGHDQSICSAVDPNSKCVEGTCKRDPYNYWEVFPRTLSDITIH